jgi:hypothetical protein
VDGLLDWYLLGVVLGFAVADGVIGGEARRPLLGIAALLLVVAAVAIALAALPWWALIAFAAVLAASGLALRRLSAPARLLGALTTTALAVVPALGYLLAVLAPLAGVRLGRRAGSRYAGLRILAKD